jgi:hypothetical protein
VSFKGLTNSRCLQQQGIAFSNIKGRLFPVIGIGDLNVHILVNFGQDSFVFEAG